MIIAVILSDLVGFILAPHVMCFLFGLYFIIDSRGYDKDGLKFFIICALYPVSVPAWSVYFSCREIFLDEDWTEGPDDSTFDLTFMKFLKMFEHIGEFYVPNN